LPQGVVAVGQGRGFGAFDGGEAGGIALLDDFLQGAEGIERAGEACVGIEL